jgi:hypothetical protein
MAEVSNMFTALENLDADVDANRALENIRNIIISARKSLVSCEMNKLKPWFSEESSKLLNQRKKKIQACGFVYV